MFTPTDVDHMLRERRRLLSLKSDRLNTVDGICRPIHESAIGVVHYAGYRSDSIHLNRPLSDSDPIIVRSLKISDNAITMGELEAMHH